MLGKIAKSRSLELAGIAQFIAEDLKRDVQSPFVQVLFVPDEFYFEQQHAREHFRTVCFR